MTKERKNSPIYSDFPFPKILIIRLSAIGDVVRALTVVHVLHKAYPEATFHWVVERKSASIVTGHPFIEKVLVFNRSKNIISSTREFLKLCREIRNTHYDIVIDAHGILKSGILVAYSGAAMRIGFSRPRAQEASYLFTNCKVRLPSNRLNRIEEYTILCSALVSNPEYEPVTIFVPLEIQTEINQFYEQTFDGGKAVIAMHVPVDVPNKQWPLKYFAWLSDLLIADGRFDVVLTWGPGQLDYAHKVISLCRRKPFLAPAMPDLKHYAWLIHCADMYFGGDTGPMHIAAAMNTPVVAVFGGTDPQKHAPISVPHEILYYDDPSLSPMERLSKITPEKAYDACIRLFLRTRRNRDYTGKSF